LKLCDKCFFVLEADWTFCKECGAPIDEENANESDAVVYPEIARSNLLRLRGDLSEAEKVCLGVLKRFPNNPAAHGMMGDLSFESGRLDEARRWYEMALDLTPSDEGLVRKLKAVAEATAEEQARSSLAGLEVTPRSGSTVAAMLGVVALVVIMGALMFWLGYANKKTRADVIDPISINGDAPTRSPETSGPIPEEPQTRPDAPEPRPAVGVGMTAEEAAALSAVGAELEGVGSRVVTIILDPTGAVATVTAGTADRVDAAQVGAWLVRRGSPQAFVRILDPASRSVRFSATITRAALDAAVGEPGSAEWAASVLGTG
jgi:hypothetical protein